MNRQVNPGNAYPWLILVLCFISLPFSMQAQNATYTQFSPEIQLIRAFSDKWAGEINLNNTFSNTPEQSKVFKTLIQGGALVWVHYFYSPRWKFTSGLAYYYNHDSPEIGQYESNEWRPSVQGIYYFHKIGYTLSTRMRGEIRFVTNKEGVYGDTYRYRQQVKFLKPINSQVLRQGVIYAFGSEEIIFRSQYKSEGLHYFDRNTFQIGAGYNLTDNMQLELTYCNEFMPRDNSNQVNNIFSFTFIADNLAKTIRHKIAKWTSTQDDKE